MSSALTELLQERQKTAALTAQLKLAHQALIAAGFTQFSAMNHWRPPLGKRPDFESEDVVNRAREFLEALPHRPDREDVELYALKGAIEKHDTIKRTGEMGAAITRQNVARVDALIASLGEVKVAFGLTAQGHLPKITEMLTDGRSWPEIGREIGWDHETARKFYERESKS